MFNSEMENWLESDSKKLIYNSFDIYISIQMIRNKA